ncbi:MAG TPA: thioredoxin family protein [Bacteroidia bacterium]|nr:thioredoxin family protein [Bacteroidia bacterium]
MKKIILILTVIATGITMNSFTPPSPGYSVGDKAADFKLKNVDGKMVSLADYKEAKGFIVIFTCNHCPFAQAYEQRIIDLHNKYASQGFPVLAVNPNDKNVEPDDSYENMISRAKEKNYPFPYLYDETQEQARAYGATRTPHVFVLGKKGTDFVVQYIGAIDDNTDDPSAVKTKYVENAVEELLTGKKVSNNFTKAIGCTIKWRKA